ncbi:MAG: sugar ABC transporter substrate-binding protein, partial [Mesorhizobium sp.]
GCAIAVDPASNAFTKAIVERAGDAGAKIVNLWNRPDDIHPWDTASDAWVANISFDGVDSGYRNGMELCKVLKGKGNIAALEGIPDNPPAKQRLAGLKKAVAECPGMKLLDVQVGNWDQTQGQSITRAWLTKYGTNLNGIFSSNDGMALGAVESVYAAGKGQQVTMIGVDGNVDAVKSIKEGRLNASVAQLPYLVGKQAVENVKKALAGEKVEESVAVPTLVLTKDVLDAGKEPMLQYVK